MTAASPTRGNTADGGRGATAEADTTQRMLLSGA